jgi:tol-pal system protein YbgF
LKEVIEACDKFGLKLRALKSAMGTDPRTKKEAADFQFVLQDALDALKSSIDIAREYRSENNSDSLPPDVLYNNALGDFNAGKNDLAAQEFTQYLQVYGKSDLAGNAQFYLGEIDYRRGNYQSAIQDYNKVLDQYPGGNKGAAAQLKKGFALLELGQKDAGVQELRSLIARYPRSPEALQARERLAKLGAAGAASKGKPLLSGVDLSSLGA